jgi:hypothetical protein
MHSWPHFPRFSKIKFCDRKKKKRAQPIPDSLATPHLNENSASSLKCIEMT